mmetsp:Transcript_40494/g.89987  ORF Transcript_40494/g.89987 Transcript_40494/m.89987 type:complete len:375 (+) Transcript_40494:647-1771(+)
MSSSRLRMFSLLKRGFMSPMAVASFAKSDVGRRWPDADTGRRMVPVSRRLMSLSRSRTHTSRSSSQCARRMTFCTSSGGMKASMTMSLSCIWSCSMRMLSSRSSFSRWNSLYMSSTSAFTSWNFLNSFFSFLVFCSASSALLLNFSSIISWFSSISTMRFCFSSSSFRLLSSSSSFLRSSFSFLRVTSTRPPLASPFRILLSMLFSFLARASFSARIFSASSAFLDISSCILACLRCSLAASSSARRLSSSRRAASCFALSSASARSVASCSSVSVPDPTLAAISALSWASISARIFSSIWGSRALGRCTTRSTTPSSPTLSPSPPSASSMALSLAISSWNSRSMASLGSSLIRGLFWMFLARLAYLRVLMVSS